MKNKTMVEKDINRRFDAYLKIQKYNQSKEPYQDINDYIDYTEIWAESRFLRGRNLFAARSANVKTDVDFITHYRADLTEDMRIIFNEKIYNIESILPLDNSKKYIVIKAYEVKHDLF